METRNVTLVRPDNTVIVDGKAHAVDLSSMHEFISVVQWDGAAKTGHIEFVQAANTPHRLNIDIADISGWSAAIEAWDALEAAEAAAAAAAESDEGAGLPG